MLEWIGLKFNPSLLLPIIVQERLNDQTERNQWIKEEHVPGYYIKNIVTRLMAWDIREECED